MLSVAESLEKAAEHDRLANEAQRPSQKKKHANMAEFYRFMARELAKIDTPPTPTKPQ
jgi:hypothetical protein